MSARRAPEWSYSRHLSHRSVRRILFTNHLAPGSASSYRQSDLAKYMGRLGFECCFIGLRPKGRQLPAEGSPPLPGWPFKSMTYWDEPLVEKFAVNLRRFRRSAREASMIHTNKAYPYTASLISLGNFPRRRLTVDMEELDGFGGYASYARFYGPKGLLLTFFEDTLPRFADLVLAVSHVALERMRQLGIPQETLRFVPNGYDEDRFDPSVGGGEARERYALGDARVVVYITTFHRFEAELHRTALAAFKLASREVPDAKMLVVGGGNLDVPPLIADLQLQGRVVYAGRVPREKIPQIIAAADVAIHVISDHAFHRSGSPMVMPEYMAMGKAIVAPRIGELAFALQGGSGLLVDRSDPRLLAEGLVRLLKDSALREVVGREALRRARAEYSYRVLAQRLSSAYSLLPTR